MYDGISLRMIANRFKNVHEGPIGIGTRVQYSEVPLSVGNVISNGKAPVWTEITAQLTTMQSLDTTRMVLSEFA